MSCPHLNTYLSQQGTDSYRAIHVNLVSAWTEASLERKSLVKCLQCGNFEPRLHACLHCIHAACSTPIAGTAPTNHRDDHATDKNHPLSVELSYGHVYCTACQDYVYHQEFEAINESCHDRAFKHLNGTVRFTPWRPTPQEVALLRKHRKRKGFMGGNLSTVGLRGLINLGNTCFMSCIVQTLIHTPLLRDYFLSDRHLCLFDAGEDSNEKKCIVCEMSRLFQEFYSGAKSPLVPHLLLHMTWQHAHHLAGYEQQDAHEFFIATLDLLHRHLIHRTEKRPGSACDCIVDTIFTGKLQSDVVCQVSFLSNWLTGTFIAESFWTLFIVC